MALLLLVYPHDGEVGIDYDDVLTAAGAAAQTWAEHLDTPGQGPWGALLGVRVYDGHREAFCAGWCPVHTPATPPPIPWA